MYKKKERRKHLPFTKDPFTIISIAFFSFSSGVETVLMKSSQDKAMTVHFHPEATADCLLHHTSLK